MKYYDKFKADKYSGNVEDGIMLRMFYELKINPNNSWCVDVGGLCETKFETLKELPKQFPKVTALNYVVVPPVWTKEQRESVANGIQLNDDRCGKEREEDLVAMELDDILKETNIPEDYDLLNIDTDTCDHEIWQGHKKYKPKIVIIEINSSVSPDELGHVGEGTSYADSMEVAKEMGYSLVCHSGNMIYVRDDILDKLHIPKTFINSVDLFNRSWL